MFYHLSSSFTYITHLIKKSLLEDSRAVDTSGSEAYTLLELYGESVEEGTGNLAYQSIPLGPNYVPFTVRVNNKQV